jgi:predicted nicotinamide N-methyase
LPPLADPLRVSLTEQLVRMRGSDELPEALLDVVRSDVSAAGSKFTLLHPRDWDELRHQEGAEGRTAPYWARAWPSGFALADALQDRVEPGARVLELGCGLGVPSLAAARAGAHVLATDGSPDAVAFAAHNLAINGLEGEAALVDWRDADALVDRGPWDLVLAADVLYLRHNVEALLRVLPRLGADALIADPNRAGGRDFVAAGKRLFDFETTRVDERVSVHALRIRSRP